MFRYSLVTLTLCASVFAATTPKGLSTSAWSSIRSEYQRHRQAAFAVEGGWQARNYGQDWSMFFDGRGFEVKPQHGAWRWGLRLSSYGYQGQQRRVDKARAVAVPDVEKFSYQWDSVIREWYVNGAGLEHGYTLESRPGDGTGLQLHLEVLGTLQARVAGDGQGVAFLEGGGGPVVLNYGGLKVTDATGRLLASRFYGEASGGLRLEVDDAGARYPVTVDPIAQQQAYLKASNVGQNDQFGASVAVSGDTVVVGAPGESSGNGSNQADNSAVSAGAAYVFTSTGGVWTQQAYLKASNVGAGDSFGQSVAISGDTVFVGASGEASNGSNQADNSASFSGAAYVFTRTSGVWTQQAYLKASNVGVSDFFGFPVAVSGDTAVVGASREASNGSNQADNSLSFSGAAYVFTRTSGVWTQQAYLKASNVGEFDQFGYSVAVSGDTVVVGARLEASGSGSNPVDNSAPFSGAVYVFMRTSGVWTQQAYLKASNVGASDEFGYSVAVSGDTAVVGAPGEASGNGSNQSDNSALNSGATYVFTRTGGVWTQQAYLKASNVGADDSFGSAVAVSGDTVVVGAFGEDGNGSIPADNSARRSGAAYVFTRTSGVWTPQAYLKASNVGEEDFFGSSVAVSGDTVVVGAFGEDGNSSHPTDNGSTESGAAYVFTVFPAQAVSLDVPKQIPDNTSAGVTSVLTITDPGIIADLNLTLTVNHPCLASLDVSLTPPGGTPVKLLVAQNGLLGQSAGCGQNFVATTLDDQAPTLLTNGSSPGYSGSFNVNHVSVGNNPLAKFNGLLAAGTWTLTIADRAASQTGTLVAWGLTITPAAAPPPNTTGLRFVPVTPCRLVDTREASLGAFGTPALVGNAARSFIIPQQTACGIPSSAAAYAINLTVVPKGPLGYVTIWPAGAVQPLVSTLNSIDGRIKANAAVVPAGASGAISVFATNATELVLDINGYFIDPGANAQALAFYPITPCRVADTRNANGSLGGPVIAGGTGRSFPVLASNCGVAANAQAYSINATVVPSGPLGYLTLWPTGQAQPLVSTLNALTGGIVANAAIVPAGTNGAISAFVTNASHLVLDINGYFAPPEAANAQRFFAVTPCRLLDTRNATGEFGGPVLAASQGRSYRLPLTPCNLSGTAAAYSLNATVVPTTGLGYLTLWPTGTAQPLVSTLNAVGDAIVANAAIVPAGTAGAVSSFVTNETALILDTNGYFAP